MSRVEVETNRISKTYMDLNMAIYRYFQGYPRKILELLYHRTPEGRYITLGYIEEALSPGFTMMNGENPVYEDWDQTRIDKVVKLYAQIRAAAKVYSHVVITYYKFEGEKNKVLWWVEDDLISELDLIPGTKELRGVKFTAPTESSTFDAEPIHIEGEVIKDFRVVGQFDKTISKFRSWLEPIIDDLINIVILRQQLSALNIRAGSGWRYAKVPASYMAKQENQTTLKNGLENMGINSIWQYTDGQMDDFEIGIMFPEGATPIDIESASDAFLTPISIYTKIPKEALKGNELGLRSAETNRQAFLNGLSAEQQDSNEDLIWMLSKEFEAELNGEEINITHLEWNPLVEVDETEALTIKSAKLKILQELAPDLKRMGLDIETVAEYIQLDVKIDPSLIAEFETEREEFMNNNPQDIGNDNNPDKGDAQGNTEET